MTFFSRSFLRFFCWARTKWSLNLRFFLLPTIKVLNNIGDSLQGNHFLDKMIPTLFVIFCSSNGLRHFFEKIFGFLLWLEHQFLQICLKEFNKFLILHLNPSPVSVLPLFFWQEFFLRIDWLAAWHSTLCLFRYMNVFNYNKLKKRKQ